MIPGINLEAIPAEERTPVLEEILAEGRATGKLVRIYVEHFNPARRLYDQLGFRHVDTNGVYHQLEWSAPAPETQT